MALAEQTGGSLVTLEGSGHGPHVRDPVKVNLLLRDFVVPPSPTRWTRGKSRRRRALFVSSPIGLGHAQRDVAIARELRKVVPDLEIDWLAQHPVTKVLEGEGERIHPASAELANESTHIESESAEHDLHCFQAWRRMDEILLANFMVFDDLVREEQYDLWIGDEAWELDYYLHENPEQKRAAYVWLTDFVGWLPMPDGGERESFLTADYNAEMIEHIARFPRLRDRAIFVGNPDDVVPDSFGGDLPLIRDWTEQHYDFAGYVSGFDPEALGDRERLRAELGYGPGEQVCIVTVGGSGVGGHLLRRVIESFPGGQGARSRASHGRGRGASHRSGLLAEGGRPRGPPYVHNLYRHLAACDLAVVQGGLTTAMELTANRRPVPLFPPSPPFRAELPRPPPAQALRRRPAHGLRRIHSRRNRRRDRRGDRSRRRLRAGRDRRRRARRGAHRGGVAMTEEQAIKSTVLDYFEGWFDGDAGRMERALHPQLAKRSLGEGKLDEDTAPEMIEATAAGSRQAPRPRRPADRYQRCRDLWANRSRGCAFERLPRISPLGTDG